MKKFNWGKIRLIAGFIVVCMIIGNAGLLNVVINKDYEVETCIVENHDIEHAYADGDFSKENSDNEERKEDYIEVNKSKALFNILEIVPNESMGVIGYSVAGCEPITNSKDAVMREACMDALLNKVPGVNNANDQNLYMNTDMHQLSTKMQEGGVHSAFDFEAGKTYSGYYKYVGDNKGVYAIGLKADNSYEVDKMGKSAIMVSKFYPTAHKNTGKFDYIWEYTDDSASNTTTDDYKYIYVKNHRRLKYINNDKFLRDSYGLTTDSAIATWKNTHQVEVVTKTPLTVSYANIEKADLIVINSGNNMDYYQNAINIYNKVYNKSFGKDNFSSTIDFPSFEYVIRIYERTVVRQDVALVASRNCINGSLFDTNLRKLMCMLFYVNKGSAKYGSGREVFMDFMKRYVDEPGTHKTINPETGSEVTYYELRNMTDGDKYKAPTLRNGAMSDGTFMHKTHPLVMYANDSITGWHYDDNNNVVPDKGKPDTEKNYMNRRTAKRDDTTMYTNVGATLGLDSNANHEQKKEYKEKEGEFYFLPYESEYGVTKQQWSASEREKKELNDYKGEYEPYRWRMPLYESKSNTTDYVYIDDNGRFIRDGKYSGQWYGIDALTSNGDVWEYKVVKWNAMNENTWPWNVVEGGCLKEWWFGDGSTWVDGDSKGKHIHLYYDYYAYNDYRAISTAEAGTYKNQSLEEENGLFKGDLIKNAVKDREVKREDVDPKHVDESGDADKSYYCLAMNILNGDGYNKTTTSSNKNKVLYVNSYEMDEVKTPFVPIKFRIRTSSDIIKLELLKKEGTNLKAIKTYIPEASNNITLNDTAVPLVFSGGATSLKLKRIRDDNTDGTPKAYTGPIDSHTYVYTFEGTINDLTYINYKKGSNNKFVLRATIKPVQNKPEVTAEDNITIAVRDFFELN